MLLLASAALGQGGRRQDAAPEGLIRGSLEHDGRTREFYLDPGGSPAGGRPLVVVLHGGRGSAERIAGYAGFDAVARREGLVVAYPQAVERNWNDGRDLARYASHREGVDDVGFLSALIDRIVAEQRVDPDRVYLTGPSNGGMMTYRMALEAPEKLAAAAAVIANLPERLAEAHAGPTDEPVPLLIVNGTADPLVPHAGGEITFGIWGGLGRVLSSRATAEFFAARGGCGGEPRREPARDADPGDAIEVERHGFGDAAARCSVELYLLDGGGHTWPGGPQLVPRAIVGPATRSLDAAEVIWSFFARHSRTGR